MVRLSQAVVTVALFAVPLSAISLAETTSRTERVIAAHRPVPNQPDLTCNSVPAADIGACVTRMLADPRSAYAAGHVVTRQERQPVAVGKLSAAAAVPNAGSWSVVANCRVEGYKVNAIHASVTRTGKVLLTAGSGYSKANFDSKVFKAWLWNPAAPRTCPRSIPMPAKDLFCSGHSHLPDGRILFFGGTARYGDVRGPYYGGIRETYVFDDSTETFRRSGLMKAGRWYPNGPVNAAGNPVVIGGLDLTSELTSTNEIYSPATGQWAKLPGRRTFPMYAGMVLRRTGELCYTGTYFGGRAGVDPQCWNWSNNATKPITGLPYPDCRDQANTVLLYPAQAQRAMVIGGGCAESVTATTATVDLDAKNPRFVAGPRLPFAAMHSCATVLPDGSTFVAGGGDHNTRPRLQAARLALGGTKWQRVASPRVPRLYHSTCLPLPDGSVVTMGTNTGQGFVESRFEVYKPWYMQPGVRRPALKRVPTTVRCGGTYAVEYISSAPIKQAALTRLSSVTHSTDPNQRMVQVPLRQAGTSRIRLTLPTGGGLLPPGHYMLSLKDSRNVPSKASIVRVLPAGTATDDPGGSADGCCH